MMRRLLLAALLPLALAACKTEKVAAPEPPRPVVSELISPQSGLRPSYVGTVAARTETDLGFPINGTVASRSAHEGDVVAKGDTLAQLDPHDLDSDLRAAEAGVTVVEAQLKSAQDAADRASELVQRGVDSAASAESATTTLAAVKAQYEQAQASLARARDQRSYATLRAPQDGVITQVYAQPGAILNAGQPVLRLAGTDEREVVIDLSDQDVAGLVTGAIFRVRLEAATEIETRATLRSIDPVAERATRTRRLHLTLRDDASAAFRIGALALVEPDAETAAHITIPTTALMTSGAANAVWLVDRHTNAVHRAAVETGPRRGDRVLVLSGLKDGDEVITKGVNSIKDGQIVGPRVTE